MIVDSSKILRWSKGSCGEDGCTDPECACAVCGRPIGVPEHDPRWNDHDEDLCQGCELCDDLVPSILWRGEGKHCEEARMHNACFRQIITKEPCQ